MTFHEDMDATLADDMNDQLDFDYIPDVGYDIVGCPWSCGKTLSFMFYEEDREDYKASRTRSLEKHEEKCPNAPVPVVTSETYHEDSDHRQDLRGFSDDDEFELQESSTSCTRCGDRIFFIHKVENRSDFGKARKAAMDRHTARQRRSHDNSDGLVQA